MGGDNENGKFNSFLITFVFNLVGTGYSSVDMKVKKLNLYMLCWIALKLE